MVAPVGKTVDSEASANVATDIIPATTISAMRMGRLGPQDTFITSSISRLPQMWVRSFRWALLISAFDIGGMLSVDYEFMNTYSQQWRRRGVVGWLALLRTAKVKATRAADSRPDFFSPFSSEGCWSVMWLERRAW